ncbi:MAG: hypothetical protein ACK55Z_36515, partial [bacterium]
EQVRIKRPRLVHNFRHLNFLLGHHSRALVKGGEQHHQSVLFALLQTPLPLQQSHVRVLTPAPEDNLQRPR